MKTCIYGAGAIGGWIGMALAQSGARLNAIARGATLRALQHAGLQLIRPDGSRLRAPVHAVATPEELGPQDLVVIAVKAPALSAVAQQIKPLLAPHTVVLTAMNGVPWWFLQGGFGGPLAGRSLQAIDPDGVIAANIPASHVVGGVVHASCSLDAPAVVRHHFGNGLILGEPSGESSARVSGLVDQLTRGGIDATVSQQIQRDIWFKLWGNMTINPVSALTGATADQVLDDELVRNFLSAVMLEAREIGARVGVPIEQSPDDRHAVTRKLGAFKTSMLQDVEAGRPVELDALVSVVRELGQSLSLATPFTDALLGLARLHARGRGLYP